MKDGDSTALKGTRVSNIQLSIFGSVVRHHLMIKESIVFSIFEKVVAI